MHFGINPNTVSIYGEACNKGSISESLIPELNKNGKWDVFGILVFFKYLQKKMSCLYNSMQNFSRKCRLKMKFDNVLYTLAWE